MKLLDKILVAIIICGVLSVLFIYKYSNYKIKQSQTELAKVQSENEVLKESLRNPKVVVKPTVRYIKQTEYITVKDTGTAKSTWGTYGRKWATPSTDLKPEFHEIVTEIIEVEGGKVTEPIIPEKKEPQYLEQQKKFSLLTQYRFDKCFSLGLGYNLFQNIAVGIGINTDEKLDIWAVWRF